MVCAALLHSFSSTLANLPVQDYVPSGRYIAGLQGVGAVGCLGAALAVVGFRPLPRRCLLVQALLAVAGNAIPLVISTWPGLLLGRLLQGLSSPFPIAIRFLTLCAAIHLKQSYWLCILTGSLIGLFLSPSLSQAISLTSLPLPLSLGLCAGGWVLLSGGVYVYFPECRREETMGVGPFVQSVWSPWLAGWTVAVCRMAVEAVITLSPILLGQIFNWDNWLIALLLASCQALNLYLLLLVYASTTLFSTLTKATFILVPGALVACCSPNFPIGIAFSTVLISMSGPLSDLGAFAYFSTVYPKSEGRWLIAGQFGAVSGNCLVWIYLSSPATAWPSVFLPIFLLSLAVAGLLSLRMLLRPTPRHNNDRN